MAAFAIYASLSTRHRLPLVFHRENAISDWDVVASRDLHQPVVGIAANDIVVRGFATDNATKRYHTMPARMGGGVRDEARSNRLPQHLRDFECPGHAKTVIAHTLRLERRDGAIGQLIGDLIVKAPLDDEHSDRKSVV